MIVYHASPNPHIKKLYDDSFVSIFPHIAFYMGLYHKNTGETWTNDDLQNPYSFEKNIYFKQGRKPKGEPTLYCCEIDEQNIVMHHNFPWEFQIKKGVKVKVISSNKSSLLLKKSKQMAKLFEEINF